MAIHNALPLERVPIRPRTSSPAWAVDVRALVTGAGLWTVSAALLAIIQFSTPALVGVDGYYHLRVAQLIGEVGWLPAFPWLPLTILSPANYYDHHFLYHLLLAPFARGDPSAGGAAALALTGKVATVFFASLASLAIWVGLRRHVRWAALWTLGLFALSEAFLYRMSMPRAQAASLLVLVIGFFLLAERRDGWLAPLGFVFVWLYDAFPLLLLVAACRVASDLVVERRLDARPILYASIGIGLGLLINPYFPRDLAFVAQHLLPKLGSPGIPVGNEWYPYDTWTLATNSGLAFVALGVAIYALGKRNGRLDRATVMAVLLAFAFGLLFLKARRFAEYFPPFSLLALAFSASPWLAQRVETRHSSQKRLLLPALLVVPLIWTTWQARQTVSGSTPLERFGPAATWLARHSQPGEMVFQTDWDDFPRLFFFNTTNVYTVGLDPTYLQLAHAALYDEWVAITRGEVEAPGSLIMSRFGAGFVFSDLEHTAFLDRAETDPRLEEIYRDRTAVIYRVLPSGER
jgi:hypothetical protein